MTRTQQSETEPMMTGSIGRMEVMDMEMGLDFERSVTTLTLTTDLVY
jgi:hypothetical protein